MTVSTQRTFEAQTVSFAVGGLDACLAAAAVHCGYVHVDDLWRRTYPRDGAHTEEAWENFTAHIGSMLRQAARLDPVPWQDALELVCRRTDDLGIDWWLAGALPSRFAEAE